jgi:hypothetical protein
VSYLPGSLFGLSRAPRRHPGPVERADRHLAVLDPKTKKYTTSIAAL